MSQGKEGVRVQRTEQQWRAVFEAQAGSGLNQRRYCEAHGISTAAFYNARSRFGPTPVRKRAAESAVADNFVALSMPSGQDDSGGWAIELSLGDDVVLRIRRT